MRRVKRMRILLLALSILLGCTRPNTNPAQAPRSERRSLIFGRVQLPEPVKYIAVQNNLKMYVFQGGERVHVWPDGFFFAENVLRGTYELDRVYNEKYGYLLPDNIFGETPVAERSVQYLGSYAVKPLAKANPMQGVIASVIAGEEIALLERVRREVLETGWEKLIDERLAELRKQGATQPSSAQTSPVVP